MSTRASHSVDLCGGGSQGCVGLRPTELIWLKETPVWLCGGRLHAGRWHWSWEGNGPLPLATPGTLTNLRLPASSGASRKSALWVPGDHPACALWAHAVGTAGSCEALPFLRLGLDGGAQSRADASVGVWECTHYRDGGPPFSFCLKPHSPVSPFRASVYSELPALPEPRMSRCHRIWDSGPFRGTGF